VTYAVYLIGRYSALIEPAARKLQTVVVSVPSAKSLISSLQSVLNQERVDLNIPSKIYKEACEEADAKKLKMPRIVEVQVYRDNVCAESASQYFQRSECVPHVDGLN